MNNPAKEEEPLSLKLATLAARLTPARVFSPRHGASLSTADCLALRADHAVARDAVFQETKPEKDPSWIATFPKAVREKDKEGFVHPPLLVSSQASTQTEYLLRPDLGRKVHPMDRERILAECPRSPQMQILLADGLSALALQKQGFPLYTALVPMALSMGWQVGRPIFIRRARVGIMNDIGSLLEPLIVVLLLGERPGLSTAESLSAYLAYRPKPGDTDAHRNLIASIHNRGVGIAWAARRIVNLAETLKNTSSSGVGIREEMPKETLLGKPNDFHLA